MIRVYASLAAVTKGDAFKISTMSRAVQMKYASCVVVSSLTLASKAPLHETPMFYPRIPLRTMVLHKNLAVQGL